MSKNKTNKKEELIIETPETETPAAEEAAQAPVGETELLAQAEAQRDEYLDALLRERRKKPRRTRSSQRRRNSCR